MQDPQDNIDTDVNVVSSQIEATMDGDPESSQKKKKKKKKKKVMDTDEFIR